MIEVTTRDVSISFAIRAIKTLLKSKLSHVKLIEHIHSHNKKILSKIRATGKALFEYEVLSLAEKDKNYIHYPIWMDGIIGVSSRFKHYNYQKTAIVDYSGTIDMTNNINYITALHIIYLRLRNSSKKHTHDDNKWIEDNNFYYKRIASTLCSIFAIPETAFDEIKSAEVSSG